MESNRSSERIILEADEFRPAELDRAGLSRDIFALMDRVPYVKLGRKSMFRVGLDNIKVIPGKLFADVHVGGSPSEARQEIAEILECRRVGMVSVALNGSDAMLKECMHGVEEVKRKIVRENGTKDPKDVRPLPKIIGTTIIDESGFSNAKLDDVGLYVLERAELAQKLGMTGISVPDWVFEKIADQLPPELEIIVKGTMPVWCRDRTRSLSTGRAIELKASYVMLGNYLTEPSNHGIKTPILALDRTQEEIEAVLQSMDPPPVIVVKDEGPLPKDPGPIPDTMPASIQN